MTVDRLSALPAELALRVLLHLPDLKALYAATLASPRLWTIFQQNADHIFWSIVNRSMPDGLITPMALYMKVRVARSQSNVELITAADLEAINEETKLPPPLDGGLFHVVAQAVRIHDLAVWVLRTKLDYLATLTYYEIQDPDKYRSSYSLASPKPTLRTIPAPSHLKDPSWVEETRTVRALWLLAAAWRSERYSELSAGLSKRIASTIEELRVSLTSWPTLRRSETTTAEHTIIDSGNLSILECYKIPTPLCNYGRIARAASRHAPSDPKFSVSPAQIPETTHESNAWEQSEPHLRIGPYDWTSISANAVRPNCPWRPYAHALETFRRLGFILWDRHRTSTELNVHSLPQPFLASSSDSPSVNRKTPGYVSYYDEMCRHFELFKQEEEREKDGWKRQ